MLHILFIILKILGILLLVILGLLLLCLLAVLFVPIRYRGDGDYHGRKAFGVHLHVHWLLHVVSLRIAYEDGLRYAVKLFGFRVFGSESEEKKAESGRVRGEMQTERNIADEVSRADAEDVSELETFLSGGQTGVEELETVQAQERTENVDSAAGHPDTLKEHPEAEVLTPSRAMPETGSTGSAGELIQRAEAASEKTDAAIEKAEETARLLEEAVRRRSARREAEISQNAKDAEMFSDVKDAEVSEAEGELHRETGESFDDENPKKKRRFFPIKRKSLKSDASQEKRESFIQRIIRGFKQKWSALRQTVSNLFTQIKNLDHKRQSILAFIENEENQKSFRLIKRQLMRMLRHVFPRKLSGQVKFGVDDPYLMGQILSVAAFLYPLYGKQIELTPVMNESVLDGELAFRGRVQIGVLALMALRIWMDKNVRTQVHKYRNRGGR